MEKNNTIPSSPQVEQQTLDTTAVIAVKDNTIFSYGKKRGTVNGDKIDLDFGGNTYEFIGDVEKLSFDQIDSEAMNSKIYYDGLTIAPLDKNDIKYQNHLGEYYNFDSGHQPFSTGGDATLSWHKYYIKKVGEKNIIFEGNLDGVGISTDEHLIPLESLAVYKSLLQFGLVEDLGLNTSLTNTDFKNDQEKADFEKISKKLEPINLKMRELVKSTKYLELLRKEPTNIVNSEKWDKVINSFVVIKATTTNPNEDLFSQIIIDGNKLGPIVKLNNTNVKKLDIKHADLNNDGNDEAIVGIPSGGTRGDLGVLVYSLADQKVTLIGQFVGDKKTAEIKDNQLIIHQPYYLETDANCCPSFYDLTTYSWKDSKFVMTNSKRVSFADLK